MKSFKFLALAALAAIGLTTSASALTFTDSYTDNSDIKWLSGTGSYKSGTFDITTGNTPNYTPGMKFVLTSAKVSFAFADTEYSNRTYKIDTDLEYVNIAFGRSGSWINWKTNVEVDGSHTTGYDWSNASGNLGKTFLDDLLADGKLQYRVTMKSGDVWFKGAKIVVSGYTSVPEASSTIALLGIGLLGLAIIKRRK